MTDIRDIYAEVWAEVIRKHEPVESVPMTSVAPIGLPIGIMDDTVSGIEPLYQPYYKRRVIMHTAEEPPYYVREQINLVDSVQLIDDAPSLDPGSDTSDSSSADMGASGEPEA